MRRDVGMETSADRSATELKKISGELTQTSGDEEILDDRLFDLAQGLLTQFGHGWNSHNLVTIKRQTLSRILYLDMLYQQVVAKPGVICEFGVQWGATLATFINLRGVYEPFNHSRKIFGFDTFEGFASVTEEDGGFSNVGDYGTARGYREALEEILTIHEAFSPIPHLRKFELIQGDASVTVDQWLQDNPHVIIAMAVFDMDVYKPTRDVLEKIIPRLTKGSLLVFDELNCPHFPGETIAVQEVLGLNNLRLRRFPHQPYCAWAVFGE